MKRKGIVVLIILISLLIVLTAVLLIKSVQFESKQLSVQPIDQPELDNDQLASHLSQAIRFKTISSRDEDEWDYTEFLALHNYIIETFPLINENLRREVINDYGLLYTWEGYDGSIGPILLMAHLDVVPANDSLENKWMHEPFSGLIEDDYIWGRGTLDDKGSVLAILEAVEHLLEEGFNPRRTIYLAFGYDEEVGGTRGAAKIAELLESRSIQLDFVLDEGSVITQGMVPGIQKPVALIGTCEKGYATLQLTVEADGGHSSMPGKESAITILMEALLRLRDNPFPTHFKGPLIDMFKFLGPEMDFGMRLVFANLWMLSPVVEYQLSHSPSSNAMLRTTCAITVLNSGMQENVIPSTATALVNYRIIPGETVSDVEQHTLDAINDPRVTVQTTGNPRNPSLVSSSETLAFHIIEQTVREVFPEVIVAPSIVIGGTDTKHYEEIAHDIYRFLPVLLTKEDLETIHGINERISIDNYANSILFYIQLIRNSNQ